MNKVNPIKQFGFVMMAGLMMLPTILPAATPVTGTIEKMRMRTNGAAYIKLQNCPKWTYWMLTSDAAKAMYASALSAHMEGRQVMLHLTASTGCQVQETTVEAIDVLSN